MLASSKDPYGNGFREVEIVEEDNDDFGKYAINYNPIKYKEYYNRMKKTDIYIRLLERVKIRVLKERAGGYKRSEEWARNNRLRHNENARNWRKKTEYNRKIYGIRKTTQHQVQKESGYSRVALFLWRRNIRAPLNITMAYTDRPWLKKGQWAWTFAHP